MSSTTQFFLPREDVRPVSLACCRGRRRLADRRDDTQPMTETACREQQLDVLSWYVVRVIRNYVLLYKEHIYTSWGSVYLYRSVIYFIFKSGIYSIPNGIYFIAKIMYILHLKKVVYTPIQCKIRSIYAKKGILHCKFSVYTPLSKCGICSITKCWHISSPNYILHLKRLYILHYKISTPSSIYTQKCILHCKISVYTPLSKCGIYSITKCWYILHRQTICCI
jgi:hypothetical protein